MKFKKASFIFYLIICSAINNHLGAQHIRGMLKDSATSKSFSRAVVLCMRQTDSIQVGFTRASESGSFQLNFRDTGNIIISIGYPEYATYSDILHISEGEQLNLGNIYMIKRDLMLQEFVFTGKRKSIVIKGDTIEFTADSFMNRPGATVEDLLKKLPGMTVDKNGKVTAFGKTVEKVLVDGEEFFGDDPTLATRNLEAKSVDKIQVFDQKSEQAQQTGIDDGQTTKTVNIQLKEESKKGYFGKVSGSGGTTLDKTLYEGQAMANYFKKKRKFSVLTLADNYNYDGLSWSDEQKYGGKEYEFSDDGFMYSSMGDDDGFPQDKGFPVNKSAGLHYSDQFKNGKQKLSLNYRFIDQSSKYQEDNYSKYIFPDSIYTESTNSNHIASRNKNSLSFKYEIKIDTLSLFKINISTGLMNFKTVRNIFSRSIADNVDTINDSKRQTGNSTNSSSLDITLNYNKKFKLKGRSININFSHSSDNKNSDGLLLSNNNYYNSISAPSQSIHQKKLNTDKNRIYSFKATYTEPLGKKKWFAEFQYTYSLTSQDNSMLSYNQQPVEILDSIYSNSFKYIINTQRIGAFIKADKKKYTLKVGSSFNYTQLNQENRFTGINVKYPFLNIIPEFTFNWKITKQKDLIWKYRGRTNQPTLFQIQPLRDNSDPLNISQGNPLLKQGFTHNFSLNYNFYKVITNVYLWSGIDYNLIQNDIIYNTNINEQGIRYGQYININGNYNTNAYLYYGKKLKKIYTNFSISPNLNYSHRNNFINSKPNLTNNTSISGEINFDFEKGNLPEISVNYRPSYNFNRNSVNPDVITQYWQHRINSSLIWRIKKDFTLSTDINISMRQKLSYNDRNNNFTIWNASLSKKIFKNKSGTLKFTVEDILKQRIGFNRSVYMSSVNENYYTLITRYWMLHFTWNFTDKKTKPLEDEEN